MSRLKRLLRGLLVPGSLRAREEQRWCKADSFPSGSYNFQFLRSRAEGDFVRHPDLLWSPNPYWTARAGLNAHVREVADRLGGTVYSDVLIVLNPRDFTRTEASMLESWSRAARDELADCFERLVDSQGFVKAVPGRAFHLEVVPDGGDRIGMTLGLQPGEFATAMLPNLHLGGGEDAVPLVEVFVSRGDGRFASAGTLWSDQIAFTVGAHALDNHTLPELGDSALYTVHRFQDQAGLQHKLNGERTDRLAIRTGQAHGGETVQVVDMGREKVLLEVMLVASQAPEAELPRPGEKARRIGGAPLDLPFGPTPGSPEAGTILPEDVDLGSFGAFSIIPDNLPERIHTLSERGFLLQRVHFSRVMSGYTMDLERGGQLLPEAIDPVARFEVRGERVSVQAIGRDLAVDGRPVRQAELVALNGASHEISWREGQLEFESLRRKDKRWPYLARLSTPRRGTPLAEGESYVVGRDPAACDVTLPDRMNTRNILWRDGGTASTVETRGGQVPRDRFRTDAILVASKAASIELNEDGVRLHNPSTSCPVHLVRRDGETVRVKQEGTVDVQPGDELFVGNQVFALLAPGETESQKPGKTPEPPVDLTSLPERLEEGPGSRGRRPRVGGAAGKLVEPSRTYGALLGISPAGDRTGSAPVAAPPPRPAAIPRVATQPAPAATPEIPSAATSIGADSGRLPTECAPSLDLDPTVDRSEPSREASDDSSFFDDDGDTWLLGDDQPDGAMTIVDDQPDWQHLLEAAAASVTRQQEPEPQLAVVEIQTESQPFLERRVGPPPLTADEPSLAALDTVPTIEEDASVGQREPLTPAAIHDTPKTAAAQPPRSSEALPRGLSIPAIPTMGPTIRSVRRRGGAVGLPTFGLPTRRLPFPAPSHTGD